MRLICFLCTLACFLLLCMAVFAYNLPMTMLSGAGCLVFTYLGAGSPARAVSSRYHYEDNRQEHHYYGGSAYGTAPGVSLPPPPRPNAPTRVHRQYARELAAAQVRQQIPHMPESLPDIELALKRRYVVREDAEVEYVPAALPPKLQALLAQQQAAPQVASRPLTVVASEPTRPAIASQRSAGWQGMARTALLGPPRKAS